jgi:hypothetical protein
VLTLLALAPLIWWELVDQSSLWRWLVTPCLFAAGAVLLNLAVIRFAREYSEYTVLRTTCAAAERRKAAITKWKGLRIVLYVLLIGGLLGGLGWRLATKPSGGFPLLLAISISAGTVLLLLAVGRITRELNDVTEARGRDEDGTGGDVKIHQITKKWLHFLVIWPLFAAAVLCAWLFSPAPKTPNKIRLNQAAGLLKPITETIQRVFASPSLPVVVAILLAVLLSGFVGMARFDWTNDRSEPRDRERWKKNRKDARAGEHLQDARLWSFLVFLVGGFVFVLLIGFMVHFFEDDAFAEARFVGLLVALLVGIIPFWSHFPRIVRVLIGWEEPEWFLMDRVGFSLRLAFVPWLAGFIGGVLVYVVATQILSPMKDKPWAIATLGPPLFIAVIVGGAISYVFLLGPCLEEDEREWWASLTGLLMEYALGWLAFFGIMIYGVWLFKWVQVGLGTYQTWLPGALAASWALLSQAGARASYGERSGIPSRGALQKLGRKALSVLTPPLFVAGLLVLVAWLVSSLVDDPQAHRPIAILEASHPLFLFYSPMVTDIYWTAIRQGTTAASLLLFSSSTVTDIYWTAIRQGTTAASLLFWLVLCGGVVVLACLLTDVNLFSLNAMYANRLIRCYLGASRRKRTWPDPKNPQKGGRTGGAPTGVVEQEERVENLITGFDFEDDLWLRDLLFDKATAHPYSGPFPLINTALNLVAGQELAWQDRKADSFVLTPLYCGSHSTGYQKLPDPNEDPDPDLTLGRAIAISGAAADPNMGVSQSLPQTLLMTVFNARLGRWLQNPRHHPTWRGGGPSTGELLFRELLGLTDEDSNYVHLSDGGHFENLGVYELVRRRCRYIVACDAGQDGQFAFVDLAGLIRKCRTDFGVRIELDVSLIRPPAATRLSRWHCAVGTIHYEDVDSETPPGLLVYIKSSLTGDESPDVQNYAALHPEFPHQSTADQFFNESQFESYRALGYHIALDVFADAAAHQDRIPPPLHEYELAQESLKQEALSLVSDAHQSHAGDSTVEKFAPILEHTCKQDKLGDFLSPTLIACRAQLRSLLGRSSPEQSCERLVKECDLLLRPSDKHKSDIPSERTNPIIVVDLDQVLHFRMFGRDGKMVVDTDEKRLPEQARQFEDLKKKLESLWSRHRPTGTKDPIIAGTEKDPIIDALIPIIVRILENQLRDTAEWYWNWENRSLFSEVRRRWFPPPPDLEINYKEATRAFSQLQATFRADPHLWALSREFYPELALESNANPPTPLNPESRKTSELHAVNQILIAMEQAWLGVKLEGYPEHPLNRGYLNVFRRCSGSRTVHKYWPTVRGSFNQEFVRFCERELGLPANPPYVKPFAEVKDFPHVEEALRQMEAEFAREWPLESTRRSLRQFLQDDPEAWIILGGATTEYPTALAGQYACGLIALRPVPGAGSFKISELFVWIRGPYRTIGIGRHCLEQVYKEYPEALKQIDILQVCYPDPSPTSASDQSRRDLWLNFFQHYDFRLDPEASAQSSQLILQRKRRRD